jgi:hypothetical protein
LEEEAKRLIAENSKQKDREAKRKFIEKKGLDNEVKVL